MGELPFQAGSQRGTVLRYIKSTCIKGLQNLSPWLRRANECRQCVAGQSLKPQNVRCARSVLICPKNLKHQVETAHERNMLQAAKLEE